MTRRAGWVVGVLWALCAGFPLAAEGAPGPEEKPPAKEIPWMRELPAAFERAAQEKKVLMICINARNPVGEPEEPAAKGLRDVVYKDPAVVEKARRFVCAFITAGGSSADYGELRARLGIDGMIVSPQHIFLRPDHADGAKPLLRKQYWSHGDGPEAVKKMLEMMDKALAVYRVQQGMPDTPPGDGEDAEPQSPEARATWIGKLVGLARGSDAGLRKQALHTLAKHDREGDCTTPLIPLILAFDKSDQTEALVDLVRVLGVPGLVTATPALHKLISHKQPRVRGEVAVTLEYIGCADSVKPLLARAKREKDVNLANHMYRAVGRCGAGDGSARKKLVRRASPGKEKDFVSFGALIGLAYFEGDAKAARSLEKQLLGLGTPIPGAMDRHTFLRAVITWTLSEIRDPKTAAFLRKKVIPPLAEKKSPWLKSTIQYYEAVAAKCAGQDDGQRTIDAGIMNAMWSDDARELVDAFRRGRDMRRFTPKGEWGNKTEDN